MRAERRGPVGAVLYGISDPSQRHSGCTHCFRPHSRESHVPRLALKSPLKPTCLYCTGFIWSSLSPASNALLWPFHFDSNYCNFQVTFTVPKIDMITACSENLGLCHFRKKKKSRDSGKLRQ